MVMKAINIKKTWVGPPPPTPPPQKKNFK